MSNSTTAIDPKTGLPPYIVVFGPRANCTLDLCPIQHSVYGYQPSLAANVAFLVLFGLAGLLHLIIGLRWRTWFFMGCMQLGCLSAIIGYVGRILMHRNPFSFTGFMIQITCVTTAPVYECAAIYVTLATVIGQFSPSLSRFKPKLLYWVFIPCDFFSLAVQATGGVLSTISQGTSTIGVDLALAGLAFQVFTIVFFCCLFCDYLIRYYRSPLSDHHALGPRLKVFFTFLALAILLITTRCVYRVVELNQGYTGRFVKDEGLFIGLEGVLIIAATFSLLLGHPGLVLTQAERKEDAGIRTDESYEMVPGDTVGAKPGSQILFRRDHPAHSSVEGKTT